jgi:hypothetical protein
VSKLATSTVIESDMPGIVTKRTVLASVAADEASGLVGIMSGMDRSMYENTSLVSIDCVSTASASVASDRAN